MPRTWENYECEFFTTNTRNDEGDSRYWVYKTQMKRYAPINQGEGRKHDQVDCGLRDRAVCYLDAKSDLYTAVMAKKSKDVRIVSVDGDVITVQVSGLSGPDLVATCTRKPANGLRPFDFTNDDGQIGGKHVGHEVKNLRIGAIAEATGAKSLSCVIL
jgi:hypothetical protein